MHRGVICALAALAPALSRADGIAVVGGSPRAIGRAGASVVGDDGGGALLVNPAAMARRDTERAQIGTSYVEDALDGKSDNTQATTTRAEGGSSVAPAVAAVGSWHDWVIGMGVLTSAVVERAFAAPPRDGLGPNFDYRYGGIAGGLRRDTFSLGVARRLGDTLALGVSIGLSRVSIAEHRRIWAGFGGRDMLGSPKNDVDLILYGDSWVAPSAVAGLLYAPEDSQIELGASVGWATPTDLSGRTLAVGTVGGPSVGLTSPNGSLTVRSPVSVRAGGRYVGERIVGELEGDLWIATAGSTLVDWDVHGIHVIDPAQVITSLEHVPSRLSQRTHVAARGAIDVELISGFLWATGGYAFSTGSTPANRLSPTFGDLGGHTASVGVEATAGGFTLTLGLSRTWYRATRAPTVLQLDNPFNAGDRAIFNGLYDGSVDQIGFLLEAELETPN